MRSKAKEIDRLDSIRRLRRRAQMAAKRWRCGPIFESGEELVVDAPAGFVFRVEDVHSLVVAQSAETSEDRWQGLLDDLEGGLDLCVCDDCVRFWNSAGDWPLNFLRSWVSLLAKSAGAHVEILRERRNSTRGEILATAPAGCVFAVGPFHQSVNDFSDGDEAGAWRALLDDLLGGFDACEIPGCDCQP